MKILFNTLDLMKQADVTPGDKPMAKFSLKGSMYAGKGKGDVFNGRQSDYKTVFVNGTLFGKRADSAQVLALEKGERITGVYMDISDIYMSKNGVPVISGVINEYDPPYVRKTYQASFAAPDTQQTAKPSEDKPAYSNTSVNVSDEWDSIG